MIAASSDAPEAGAPEIIAREVAVGALARRLYETMDRVDPSPCLNWHDLEEENRDFYRACVRDLLAERTVIQAALAVPAITR